MNVTSLDQGHFDGDKRSANKLLALAFVLVAVACCLLLAFASTPVSQGSLIAVAFVFLIGAGQKILRPNPASTQGRRLEHLFETV